MATRVERESYQEGARWFGDRPDPKDVASWFRENADLKGLEADRYIGGVVMISAIDKSRTANAEGNAWDWVERMSWTPYVKVETRVQFFWDWCREEELLGSIQPVAVPRSNKPGYSNEHMPPGFFRQPVENSLGQFTNFVACSMQVHAFRLSGALGTRHPVLEAPPAVKMIAVLDRDGNPDPFSLMKAETGAIGRALGMAGMLTIPGSGIATAEDMAEVASAGGAAVPGDSLPSGEPAADTISRTTPRELMGIAISRLEAEAPDKFEAFASWASTREIKLDKVTDEQVRAVLKNAEKAMKEAGLE